MKCIPFDSEESMWKAFQRMLAFQRVHNLMAKELNALMALL